MMQGEGQQLSHGEYLARRFQQICDAVAQLKPELASELRGIVTSMMANEHGFPTPDPASIRYAQCRIASDAAVEHLKSTPPFTLNREQLLMAILAGGWGLSEDRREYKARIAIGYSISRTHRIVERHDGRLATFEQAKDEGL